jgi:hypothetical protein
VLSPELSRVPYIQPYRNTIIRALGYANAVYGKKGRVLPFMKPRKRPLVMDYHFGSNGATGCGMYTALSRHPDIGKILREKLHTPEQIIAMLKKIRDELQDILQSDCQIRGTVIDNRGRDIIYDLDDRGDVNSLLKEKDLAL